MKKALIYLRGAAAGSEDSHSSLDRQREEVLSFAAAKGYTQGAIIEESKSGAITDFSIIEEYISVHREIRYLRLSSPDRLTRNIGAYILFAERPGRDYNGGLDCASDLQAMENPLSKLLSKRKQYENNQK